MPSQISNLTNFADQLVGLQLPDGTVAQLELVYNATTERWVFNLSYGSIVLDGVGLCTYPNVLRQWKNILPFGIACCTSDQTDPVDVNDFASGRVSLFILDSADVSSVESQIIGGPQS